MSQTYVEHWQACCNRSFLCLIRNFKVGVKMSDQLSQKINRKGLTVWRIHNGLSTLFLIIATIVLFVILKTNDFNMNYVWIGVGIIVLHLLFFVVVFPYIRWKRWGYEVREAEIEIQRGLFIVKRTLIPMARVQHVDTTQGPLLRMYGVADLTISTAATVHIIPAIAMDEADELRRRISTLARMAKDDV